MGIIIGFVIGIGIRETDPSDDVIMWLGMFLVVKIRYCQNKDIVACQAHPVLVKIGPMLAPSFSL